MKTVPKGLHYLALPPGERLADGSEEADKKVVTGVAMRYGEAFERWPGFEWTLQAGCFGEIGDVRMLLSHDDVRLLGRTKSGTLKIDDGAENLSYRCLLPDSPLGQDVFTSVARGDLDGASIGFSVVKYETTVDPDTGELLSMEIEEAELYEISLTAAPVYKDSSAAAADEFKVVPPPAPVVPASPYPSLRSAAT